MLDKGDITDALVNIGVASGDIVMVHSSFKAIAPVKGGPRTVIDALLGVLSESGTLIMPTFNFDFCLGKTYDRLLTKSDMGILTEIVRTDLHAHRVFNPIYSFAMIGKMAEELSASSIISSFGEDSLFERFHNLNGKILAIGVPYQKSFTFMHYVEQSVKCNYRFVKEFSGEMIDESGKIHKVVCDMGVRNISHGVDTYIEPMGAKMEEDGVVKVGRIGNTHIKLANAIDFYEATKRIPLDNPELLRKIVENPRIH